MTVPVPPEQIGDSIRRFFMGMQVPDVAPDMTQVARGTPPRVPTPTMGPAAPHYAQPVGGVMGKLLSAGPMGEHMLRDASQHPVSSVAQLAVLSALPFAGAVGSAAAPVAAAVEEGRAAGLSAEQLMEWRKIEQFLGHANTMNRSNRAMSSVISAARAVPAATSPMLRAGVEDMAIPASVKPGLLSAFP